NNKNSLLGAIRRLKPAVLRSSLNREFLELKTVGLKSEVLNPPVFNNFARRYHWLSDSIVDFVEEPHSAICCDSTGETLDLTARQSCETRNISVDLINDNPQHIFKFFEEQKSLLDFFCNKKNSKKTLMMPARHWIQEIDLTQKDREILNKAYELQPKNYEELISLKGMGAKKLRALALISDLVYGSEASWKDPVKYSFSHGGKDGTPFPVDKPVFDNSINFLKDALESAKIGNDEKTKAIKRLYTYVSGYQSFGVTAKLL
ncbi:MAG TPA: DUF763 domain-containing protein, partial [Candidatus Nanoarchaeia archaeon]|nr:DUF763 domain-containing protein [Candidatus Nanoarchaeia archaeon]